MNWEVILLAVLATSILVSIFCKNKAGKPRDLEEVHTDIGRLVRALTDNEAECVIICADNAEFGGHNNIIYSCGEHTAWEERPYYGDSVIECLEAAMRDKIDAG